MSNIFHTHLCCVFSVFYVFYEQYLTVTKEAMINLSVCLSTVLGVTFILMGCDLYSALMVFITICMIIGNLMGLMVMWNISLNAVSLVNLIMVSGCGREAMSTVILIVIVVLVKIGMSIFNCMVNGCGKVCICSLSTSPGSVVEEKRVNVHCQPDHGQWLWQRVSVHCPPDNDCGCGKVCTCPRSISPWSVVEAKCVIGALVEVTKVS